MLVIRSKCMLEKQAEGLQRSTGALPVHGCASDWPCLSDTKQGFSAASDGEAAGGVLAVAVGCREAPPPRCCPVPPVLKSRSTETLTLLNQWRWKISAIAAFCGCPSFSFPSLRVLFSLFFPPWALDLGYKLVSCSPSLASALSELRGGGGGRGASCLREEESARMGRGERRELLRSSARSSLVHSERSDTLCWSAVAKIHLVRECWRKKKKNQSTYRASVKNVGIKGCHPRRRFYFKWII